MKTLMFVACLLTVAYAFDPESVKAFYEMYAKCAEEVGVTDKAEAKTIRCLAKNFDLYDEQGEVIMDKSIEFIHKISSDANKYQLEKIVLNCIDKEHQGPGSNDEKTIASIECVLKENVLDLVVKL